MKTFRCYCCGSGFKSDKPQDPERDTGFGTCDECRPRHIASMVEHGFGSQDRWTVEDATARTALYA